MGFWNTQVIRGYIYKKCYLIKLVKMEREDMEHLIVILRILTLVLIADLLLYGEKETESTWAWILLLLFLPRIGFLLYILTGQNIPVQNRRKRGEERLPVTEDNRIEIITGGEEKFQKLFLDIQNAQKEILIEYYIFQNDFLFEEIRKLLYKKAAEGVQIRVLYDALGSRHVKKHIWREMEEKGIRIQKFRMGFWNKFLAGVSRVNYRNHRKVVVIDSYIGYVGGINVGKEYLGLDARFGMWRDTHFRIEGSGALSLRSVFLRDWNEETQIPSGGGKKGDAVQIVTSGPTSSAPHIRNVYLRCIGNAKKTIRIQTPYFIPDTATLNALKLALLSGKEVRLMIPCKPDHMFVYWATLYYAARLLALGAKVYIYKDGFLHAKGIIMDEDVYCFGTANMDNRSFFLNYEVNAICYGREEVKKMCAIFENDRMHCHEFTYQEYASRSLKIRIKEQISRLLSPLL